MPPPKMPDAESLKPELPVKEVKADANSVAEDKLAEPKLAMPVAEAKPGNGIVMPLLLVCLLGLVVGALGTMLLIPKTEATIRFVPASVDNDPPERYHRTKENR